MRHLIMLLGLLIASCASMQWPNYLADCNLPREQVIRTLDKRLTDRMYDLQVAGTCSNGAYTDFTACPEYHREWREYWRLRRAYDACIVEGIKS